MIVFEYNICMKATNTQSHYEEKGTKSRFYYNNRFLLCIIILILLKYNKNYCLFFVCFPLDYSLLLFGFIGFVLIRTDLRFDGNGNTTCMRVLLQNETYLLLFFYVYMYAYILQ